MKNITMVADVTLTVEYELLDFLTDELIKWAKDNNTSIHKATQIALLSLIDQKVTDMRLTPSPYEKMAVKSVKPIIGNATIRKWGRI